MKLSVKMVLLIAANVLISVSCYAASPSIEDYQQRLNQDVAFITQNCSDVVAAQEAGQQINPATNPDAGERARIMECLAKIGDKAAVEQQLYQLRNSNNGK